ncbi:zinc finger CCCH domain-containing protein 7B-like [Glandiceps talaboti]
MASIIDDVKVNSLQKVWPPRNDTPKDRRKRVAETKKLINSSKRKVLPKQQLGILLLKFQLDLKAQGNDLFREDEFGEASRAYGDAIDVIQLLTHENLPRNLDIENDLLCNRAECLLQIGDEDNVLQAWKDCENVLSHSRHHEKALFGKAKALKQLGRFFEARQCVSELLKITPTVST